MKSSIHAIAASIAMLCIAIFWTSSLVAEVFLDNAAVVVVKHAIAMYGLAVLVSVMAITGASGFALGKQRKGRLVDQKKMRMRYIALTGLLVMIPSALYLYSKSAVGQFDTLFYVVQVIELCAGLVQLSLMSLNFRDGLKLAGKLRAKKDGTSE
ncbi:hypothetical protein [Deefgea sp. CFH1-16]|uniref:hypothetical protein n=1 Tax=Deefgea sp. CFH1-16 TaxID=2675457 RepID=UPI0015F4259E|nr:hypothetical protein [Deefgea sp. CFH1-16]MBM5573193.1 hypothetical protein [Deefgea sp. CFH1-16]